EATIARWAKNDGDRVGPDDVLLELESDKATMELPAGQAGVVRIVKQAGETVVEGDVVARIEDAAGGPARAPSPTRPGAPPAPRGAPGRGRAAGAAGAGPRRAGAVSRRALRPAPGSAQPRGSQPHRGARSRPGGDPGVGQGRAADQG